MRVLPAVSQVEKRKGGLVPLGLWPRAPATLGMLRVPARSHLGSGGHPVLPELCSLLAPRLSLQSWT